MLALASTLACGQTEVIWKYNATLIRFVLKSYFCSIFYVIRLKKICLVLENVFRRPGSKIDFFLKIFVWSVVKTGRKISSLGSIFDSYYNVSYLQAMFLKFVAQKHVRVNTAPYLCLLWNCHWLWRNGRYRSGSSVEYFVHTWLRDSKVLHVLCLKLRNLWICLCNFVDECKTPFAWTSSGSQICGQIR